MHYGVGPREGKFYESLAVMPIRLVRTPDGWRFTHYDWKISVRLGNLGELYAPELERMGRRVTSERIGADHFVTTCLPPFDPGRDRKRRNDTWV